VDTIFARQRIAVDIEHAVAKFGFECELYDSGSRGDLTIHHSAGIGCHLTLQPSKDSVIYGGWYVRPMFTFDFRGVIPGADTYSGWFANTVYYHEHLAKQIMDDCEAVCCALDGQLTRSLNQKAKHRFVIYSRVSKTQDYRPISVHFGNLGQVEQVALEYERKNPGEKTAIFIEYF